MVQLLGSSRQGHPESGQVDETEASDPLKREGHKVISLKTERGRKVCRGGIFSAGILSAGQCIY